MQPVHQFHLQAFVLHRKALDPEPTFDLWPTDRVPGDEALGTTDLVLDVPQECTTEPIHGL
jgi:hypothetical protein